MLAFHKFPPFELEKPPLYPLVGEHRCTFYSLDWLKKATKSDCGTSDHKPNTLEHFVLKTPHRFPRSCFLPCSGGCDAFPHIGRSQHLKMSNLDSSSPLWPWTPLTCSRTCFSCGFWTRSTASSHQSGSAAPSLMELLPCMYLGNKQIRCYIEVCSVYINMHR